MFIQAIGWLGVLACLFLFHELSVALFMFIDRTKVRSALFFINYTLISLILVIHGAFAWGYLGY